MYEYSENNAVKLVKMALGVVEVEAVLQRLDRLTLDEARSTAAQILDVIYGLVQNMRMVLDGEQIAPGVLAMGRLITFPLDKPTSIDTVNKLERALFFILLGEESLRSLAGAKLQEDIQSWLSPPDPSKNHNIACRLRHTGTATWFVQGDSFSKWKESRVGLSSLLWIHGKRQWLFSMSICVRLMVLSIGSGRREERPLVR
jgi:hypothetical protein